MFRRRLYVAIRNLNLTEKKVDTMAAKKQYSDAFKARVLKQTEGMSYSERVAYAKKKGIHPTTITYWRDRMATSKKKKKVAKRRTVNMATAPNTDDNVSISKDEYIALLKAALAAKNGDVPLDTTVNGEQLESLFLN